jgi:hypothetical protein
MSLLLQDTPIRRRRGRPSIGSTYEERLKHIRCAYLAGKGICSIRALALDHKVTVQTMRRWCGLALTYDDDEAEGLRRELGVN